MELCMRNELVNEYVLPVCVVAQSNNIIDSKVLFSNRENQVFLTDKNFLICKGKGYIILDYGKEVCGGIRILSHRLIGNVCNGNIRIRFGESVSECCAEIGEKNAGNYHSVRDLTIPLPSLCDQTYGDTGFRFVRIDFLDEDELRKIINFDSPLPRLERAKDMFLFGCFTGLSYIDIKTLAPEHFERDSAGRIWIKKRRVKTGVLSRIPLLPMAKLILDKYKGSEKLLPIQDSADVNKYLKDIAILCKINKRITFHTSRHTFASTVTLANNISLEVVSKMLGHTNTRMTTHYAKMIDRCIGEQMDKLMDTFSGE